MLADTPHEVVHTMAKELVAAGLRPGGVVLVHSSLKALAPDKDLPGGPETVVRAFLEALGPQGTLLMPALSFVSVGPFQPVFHVTQTPACIGAIPEYFRTRLGTLRSVSPTHSVCGVGPQAQAILSEHHLDQTPCGRHSPFRKLQDAGGQIIMLGCGVDPNTSMHAVEEHVGVPYNLQPHFTHYEAVLADGRRIAIANRSHEPNDGYDARYDRITQVLGDPDLKVGRVLAATVHVIDARAMWRQVEAAMRQDPYFFVDPSR